jgi:hypothetical protein
MENSASEAPRRRGRRPMQRVKPKSLETEVASPIERPALRPALRDDDPRVRAARRAAEIRGHIGSMDEGIDEFAAPPAPDGWTYEWKRHTIMNMEDPTYQTHLRRVGWEPVPASRYPEMMPVGAGDSAIMRKGMILMERPKEITDEVRQNEMRRARSQVKVKEQQLSNSPDGQFTRDHEQTKPRIKKSFEAMPIPEE